MRTIKFRGKTIDNGESDFCSKFVTGYYVFQKKRTGIFGQTVTDSDRDQHLICSSSRTRFWEVDPETVGQFTGLLDRAGKEIYENDVCEESYINPMTKKTVTYIWKVEYSPGCWWLRSITKKHNDAPLWIRNERLEVTGNIFKDNPAKEEEE